MIFADDIKLFLAHTHDSTVSQASLQADVDTLNRTGASWGLVMNASKCACLRFGRVTFSTTPDQSPYKIGDQPIAFASEHPDLGVLAHRSLKFHSHIRKTAGMCGGLTTNILASTLCREADFVMNIYVSHIRPKLEYCSCVWNLGYLGDTRMLERIQRRWTRQVRGLEDVPYEQRLRELNLFSVQGRLLRADLIMVWKIFNGQCAASPEQLFTLNPSPRRGHPLKIFVPRTNLDIRKRSFAIRVIADWNSLPTETVMASSLDTFKRLLQSDLGQRLFDYC